MGGCPVRDAGACLDRGTGGDEPPDGVAGRLPPAVTELEAGPGEQDRLASELLAARPADLIEGGGLRGRLRRSARPAARSPGLTPSQGSLRAALTLALAAVIVGSGPDRASTSRGTGAALLARGLRADRRLLEDVINSDEPDQRSEAGALTNAMPMPAM